MDEDARLYQDQLHRANQDRMKRLEEKLDKITEPIIRAANAVECIPDLVERVEALEKDQAFKKGVIAVILFLGSVAGAGLGKIIEAAFHYIFGK